MHNRVLLPFFGAGTVPLADARSAGVGKYFAANGFELGKKAVAFRGETDLLGTGGNGVFRFDLQMLFRGLVGNGSGTGQVFVRRVGARTNQAYLDVQGPAVLGGQSTQLRNGCSQIRSERSVYMRLKRVQVDFNDLVEVVFGVGVHLGIAGQIGRYSIGQVGHFGTAGCAQVALHGGVVPKGGGGGANFGPHVADGTFSGAAQGGSPFTEIFHNGTGSAFYGKNACYFEDDVFCRSPTVQFSGQFYADQFGEFQFPGHTGHYINGVSTAHANGYHAQTTGVHRVGVGSNHHAPGEGIIFQNHLVDNARAGFPKTDAVFCRNGGQEIEDLVGFVHGFLQIRRRTHMGLN